jgi:acetolactate synthase-1/2/3 large subunit
MGRIGHSVSSRRDAQRAIQMVREHDGPALIDFRVEQEDSVYPMVPAGAALNEMIRRPSPIVESAMDE